MSSAIMPNNIRPSGAIQKPQSATKSQHLRFGAAESTGTEQKTVKNGGWIRQSKQLGGVVWRHSEKDLKNPNFWKGVLYKFLIPFIFAASWFTSALSLGVTLPISIAGFFLTNPSVRKGDSYLNKVGKANAGGTVDQSLKMANSLLDDKVENGGKHFADAFNDLMTRLKNNAAGVNDPQSVKILEKFHMPDNGKGVQFINTVLESRRTIGGKVMETLIRNPWVRRFPIFGPMVFFSALGTGGLILRSKWKRFMPAGLSAIG
ncbi:MAG: hypothetical protein KTR14_07685 [Vampirovibrio sp.]|nr:hypothetical protein [Vampirovibrio sp.]